MSPSEKPSLYCPLRTILTSLPTSRNHIPGISNNYGGSSVAAKIMQKYGFKDGQGLGKKEQGMSVALQVEKTSKRGGRIIHEKELMGPPGIIPVASSPPPSAAPSASDAAELSITEIMKSPSKVVLLRVSNRSERVVNCRPLKTSLSFSPLPFRTWWGRATWTTTWSQR